MINRWIVVPNWDEFQHYTDRDPIWIKTYTRLLHDDAYLDLTQHQALLLHRLWLAYASSSAQLQLSTASVSLHVGFRVTMHDLQALNHAGFIEFSASAPASKPLARARARARESREEQRRAEQQPRARAPAREAEPAAAAPAAAVEQEQEPETLDGLLRRLHADPKLRIRAHLEPDRAQACARAALDRDDISNRGAYFRRLLDSSEWPQQHQRPQGPARVNAQPRDPAKAVERMIRNHVITDPVELDAELTGYQLEGALADELRTLLGEQNGRT